MEFKVWELDSGVTVIQPSGKLNMVSAPALRELINSTVAEGNARIALDLAQVDFIDSSGLGALISGLKTTRQAGGDLRIASPTEQVQLVLQLTNMERVLSAYNNAESAFDNG